MSALWDFAVLLGWTTLVFVASVVWMYIMARVVTRGVLRTIQRKDEEDDG